MTRRPGNILIPAIVTFFAVAAFLLVLNFAIPPVKKTTNGNGNINGTAVNENANITAGASKNWKMYADITLNFSFKYPRDWQAKACDNSGVYIAPGEIPCGVGQESFSVIKSTSSGTLTTVVQIASLGVTNPTVADVTISGLSGKRLTGTAKPGYGSGENDQIDAVYLMSGTTLWTISGDVPGQHSVFDALLTTLTFTDPTAGWKTYENDSWGLSFKYPKEATVEQKSVTSVRIQNYVANVDGYRLKSGEFYLELQVDLNTSTNDIKKCTGWIDNGVTTVFGELTGLLGVAKPGPYGPNVAACVQSAKRDVYIQVTEGVDSNTTLGKNILSTFTFTK